MLVVAVCVTAALFVPGPARADFGVRSFQAAASNESGSVDLQAGSHPFAYRIDLALNRGVEGSPDGTLRSFSVELPPGLVGNPLGVPRCRWADFDGFTPRCAGATQVGVVRVKFAGETAFLPIYSLLPPVGFAGAFGFSAAGVTGLELLSLRGSGGGTALEVSAPELAGSDVESIEETIWGVPADPAHDAERICADPVDRSLIEGCPAGIAPKPLLSLPTFCGGPIAATVTVISAENPGSPVSASSLSRDDEGNPVGLDGCGGLRFDSRLRVRPDSGVADSPTGLDVGLDLPTDEEADQPAAATLRNAVVRLPAGLAINPSAADGLLACSPVQVGLKGAPGALPVEFTPDGVTCPDASKIGTAQIQTPLLETPLQGSVYLAQQGDNPFASLLALYVVLSDPVRGVSIKLAARVEPDPHSGQLSVALDDLPQIPFAALDLDFFSGPRSIFTTPNTCGEFAATSLLAPWSAPEGATMSPSDTFQLTAAPAGSVCRPSETQLPNRPAFEAASLAPAAGGYSPLSLRLQRENGSQRFRDISLSLPPGLTAKLAGVGECSPAQIAAAVARAGAGGGALERSSPSCPAASEVGSVAVGVGTGAPFYLGGHVYLADPYKGAPLSLAIVVPALAGPLDLGTVVVRAALGVDPRSARLTLVADPLPATVQGIPLAIRSIAINLDRTGFLRNPTSCEPMAITGTATSASGQSASLSARFQVGNCSGLPFEPKLSLRLSGALGRNGHPALRAALRANPSDAGLASAGFTLPAGELLDLRHLRGLCPRSEPVGQCPQRSRLGSVRLQSPLLEAPLEGPVYLRVPSRRLPDLSADLRSGALSFVLSGRTTDSGGRLGVSLESLPDIPLSSAVLSLAGGRRGILVNSRSLCGKRGHVGARFSAHNGMRRRLRLPVRVHGCS